MGSARPLRYVRQSPRDKASRTHGRRFWRALRGLGEAERKAGSEFPRYVILGACNSPLAYKTLQEEINVGLFLPCNVIVYESDIQNNLSVGATDAKTMLSVVGSNPTLDAAANEVNQKPKRLVDRIG
jgi:uncharacterized protein (DUF302 family)